VEKNRQKNHGILGITINSLKQVNTNVLVGKISSFMYLSKTKHGQFLKEKSIPLPDLFDKLYPIWVQN